MANWTIVTKDIVDGETFEGDTVFANEVTTNVTVNNGKSCIISRQFSKTMCLDGTWVEWSYGNDPFIPYAFYKQSFRRYLLALSSINLCGSVMDAFQFCTRPTIRCDGEKRNYSFSVRIDEKTRIPTFIVDGIRYTLEQARTNTVRGIKYENSQMEN